MTKTADRSYPRFLNSNAFIDQAPRGAMTSVKVAREPGIPEQWCSCMAAPTL
jgi:hypothetical protein